MVNVKQDHIVPDLSRLANMAWTLDLAKHVLCTSAVWLTTSVIQSRRACLLLSTYVLAMICGGAMQNS